MMNSEIIVDREPKIVVTRQTDEDRKRLDELAKCIGVIDAGTSSTDPFPPMDHQPPKEPVSSLSVSRVWVGK